MIKKIILGSLFLFSLQSFAQEGTASPYSFYGVGEIKDNGSVENRSMGGLAVLNDSIHINLQNPASLSALKLTTFSIGGTFTPSKLKATTETQKAQRTTLDYLVVAFPVKKIAFSLGLLPYSSVGYRVSDKTDAGTYMKTGKGGVNKFFIGGGYKIYKNLNVGAQIGYNFGRIEKDIIFSPLNVQNVSEEYLNTEVNGMSFNAGVNYKAEISNFDWVSSLTYAPSTDLKYRNSRTIGVVGSTQTPNILLSATTMKLPSKLALGTGIGVDKKWFVGVETTFLSKGSLDENVNDATTFESATRLAFGGYYIPKYNSFSSYLSRVVYRAGFRHENTGLVVKGESIKDTAFTLGLGMPLGGAFSNINFGAEFGKKGTKTAGLIQEDYMKFSVGLSFNDKWFVKRKFD